MASTGVACQGSCRRCASERTGPAEGVQLLGFLQGGCSHRMVLLAWLAMQLLCALADDKSQPSLVLQKDN